MKNKTSDNLDFLTYPECYGMDNFGTTPETFDKENYTKWYNLLSKKFINYNRINAPVVRQAVLEHFKFKDKK